MENNSNLNVLNVCKVSERAIIPTRATEGSAGLDLYACLEKEVVINPGERVFIPCGISIGISSNKYVALIFARSGLAVKKGITLSNGVGVIDSDYRGELGVGLYNISKEPYVVSHGDRIAQMLIMNVENVVLKEVSSLDSTERGEGGFGSTGK